MIVKSYELNKINLKKNNIYLLYGENEGLKNKVINDTFKEFLKNTYRYDEKEILNNKENFSILVLGGSQGAEIFGKIIPPVIKMIKNEGHEIEIIQQCIMSQKSSIVDFYKKNNIKNYVFQFDKDILALILSSDLAITRCGASTTAELTHTLTPFIAVPLPNSIDDHQYLNAKYYENKGCCLLLEQDNFNTENLFNLIMATMKNKNKLENIRENMKKNYNKNVYNDIKNEIFNKQKHTAKKATVIIQSHTIKINTSYN